MGEKLNVPELRFSEFIEDWDRLFLGNVLDIWSAARVHKDEWTTFGVPFFRSSDVVSAYVGKDNTKAFISFELYNKLSAISGEVRKDDVLVTGGGSIAIPYLVPNDKPLYFKDGDLLLLRDNSKNKVIGQFLYYFFISPGFRKYVASISHIGTISHYTMEQAKSTPAVLPKVDEQAAISNFFRTLDDTISLKKQQHEKTVNIKKAMLEKMFPKKGTTAPELRFEGFTGAWECWEFKDVFSIRNESVSPEHYDVDVELENLVSNRGILTGDISVRTQTKSLFRKGDTLFGRLRPYLNKWWLADRDGLKSGEIWALIPQGQFVDVFSYVLVQGETFLTNANVSSGTKMPRADWSKVSDALILAPSPEEQAAIGNFFHNLDTLIVAQQQEILQFQNIKKACLSKMFA